MIAYDFHPEARLRLDEIWEFIRAESLDAADRPTAERLRKFCTLLMLLRLFPVRATDARTSPHDLCASWWYVSI